MGSRDKDQTTPHHQPLLSSLVVRPSNSDGGGAGGGGGGRGSDYEPGEVRREPPSYSRSERISDNPGSCLWFMLCVFVCFFCLYFDGNGCSNWSNKLFEHVFCFASQVIFWKIWLLCLSWVIDVSVNPRSRLLGLLGFLFIIFIFFCSPFLRWDYWLWPMLTCVSYMYICWYK